MSRKNIISVVSLILVVGLAIDVIVAVDSLIQPSQKFIGVICQNTDDKKLCEETLQSVTGLDSVDPKAYIATLVKGTANSVIKAVNMSDRVMTKHGMKDNSIKSGLNCCKDNLQSAMDSLQLCINLVQNKNIQQVIDQSADFRNWLSAASSYLGTIPDCFDNTRDREWKIYERMQAGSFSHASQFISMSLDIVAGLPQIVQQLTSLA